VQVPDGEDGAADLETSTEPVVETADGPDTVTEESPPAEAADKTDKSVADQVPAARRDSRWRWVAAAVLALGLIGAAYEGWLLFAHHQREVAAAQALDAAEKYTLVLTGVDPGAIDQNFAEVLDGATGEFKNMYAASSEQLRQLLIENKAAAHGTVVESAVKSATKNKVEVLLFVDQSVSNKASPQAKIDRSRIVMTMEKVNGRWLAAKVDMP
jgi:Mce-associated membrane protein